MTNSSPRVAQLLSQMTLQEKLGQLNLAPNETKVDPELIRAGGVGAVICASSAYAGTDRQEKVRVPMLNALQKVAVEGSRLGIPILIGRDVIHGHKTVAPIPLGQAASWCSESIRGASEVAAIEAFADGIRWLYTPMLDIARDPRWGRVAEGYGEDPYLCSVLAKACIVGLQRGHLPPTERLAACAKHFVGYGSVEGGRDYNSGEISDFTMRNIYMPPFKAAIEAEVASIMTCFNDLGGMPVTCNPRLLREVLRDEWGFKGLTVSDWNAVLELVEHGVAQDGKGAARLALSAGVDMDMTSACFLDYGEALLKEGGICQEHIDQAVCRVLELKENLGLFEKPYTDEHLAQSVQRTPANRGAVLALARKTPVLLKNNGILPLSANTKKIGLFGPLIDERAALLGTWCLDGEAADVATIHEAFHQVLGTQVEIAAHSLPDQALSETRYVDVIVAVVGEFAMRTGETNSTTTIDLPAGQLEFLKSLHNMGVPMVVIVFGGRPLNLTWMEDNVDAILFGWHPGTEGALAIAEIVAGVTNPSGRLPVTFPRSTGQVPIYYNHRRTGRPLDPYARGESRYVDERDAPLYPFGFGLSYSAVEYGPVAAIPKEAGFLVTCLVKNMSERTTEEVVQLYVRDRVASAARPVKELKQFARITLGSGEAKAVEFELGEPDLGFYGPDECWRLEPGEFEVWVGPDSRRGDPTTIVL